MRRLSLFLPFLVLATCASDCDDKDKKGSGTTITSDPAKDGGANATPTDPPPIVLEGVDIESLTAREKREFSEHVKQLLSPCPDVPVPIAQCIQEKRDCSACVPAARFVARAVRMGHGREQLEKSYKNRFDPANVKDVPVEGSPCTGSDIAPVTIVEFADFECSACGAMFPRIHQLLEEKKSSVRFCFKFYPLPSHPHGEIAARAGIAAIAQGKFWEMHDKLFKNQLHLEQSDLDSYAKEIGLDVTRLHADAASQATTDRLAKDRELGKKLGIQGTPSIFINGRQYDGLSDLAEWVSLEVAGATAAKKAPPATADAGKAASDAAAPSRDAAATADAKK
jgi:protein-disulfide isomerase